MNTSFTHVGFKSVLCFRVQPVELFVQLVEVWQFRLLQFEPVELVAQPAELCL